MLNDRIHVVDSHTEGEPTRVVASGGPDLIGQAASPLSHQRPSVAGQLRAFREQFDWFRSAVVNEPRGSDALVGALLCPAALASATTGVIFFNNVGFLSACGHGTIGVAKTLLHLGRIGTGRHIFETPAGDVGVRIDPDGSISIDNVPSYRLARAVELSIDREFGGRVSGDIAWGGNWFFLVGSHNETLTLANLDRLTRFSLAVRRALVNAGVTGVDGAEIDHIELFGPPTRDDCDSRNFVLCPGAAYDRSPCGTGTSAKMACLFADGKLAEGKIWRQESIIGSVFRGSVRLAPSAPPGPPSTPSRPKTGSPGPLVLPTIAGGAWITAESVLRIDPTDPFRHGIRP